MHQLCCFCFVRCLVLVRELTPLRLKQRVDLLNRGALVGLLDLGALLVAKEPDSAAWWLRCHRPSGSKSFSPSSLLGRLGLGSLALGCLLLQSRLFLLRVLPEQRPRRRDRRPLWRLRVTRGTTHGVIAVVAAVVVVFVGGCVDVHVVRLVTLGFGHGLLAKTLFVFFSFILGGAVL